MRRSRPRSNVKPDQPLQMDAVHDRQKPPGGLRSAAEAVPIVGGLMEIARLKEYWHEIDTTLAARQAPEVETLSPEQREAYLTFQDLAQRTIGWKVANFRLDDDVGVLLWCPSDVLAGVQVLIELEERYGLEPGALAWEVWERRTLDLLLNRLAKRKA